MAPHILLTQRGSLLLKIDIDSAMLRCELDRVRQQVDQNLVQADIVTVDIFCLDFLNKNIKVLLPLLDLRLYDIDDTVHDLPKRYLIHIQGQLAALNLGHIQHVIDQSEQVPARHGNLAKTVLHALLIVYICHRDCGHAYNPVHRRADIMAHAR